MYKIQSLLLKAAATAMTLAVGVAHAASFDYVFQDNVTAFGSNSLPAASELLSSPYARMSVSDVASGVQIDVRLDTSYEGWLDMLSFEHRPALDTMKRMDYLAAPIAADQPYFYSSRGAVNGSGTSYATYPSWTPISTNFVMHYGNPFGDHFSINIENMPAGMSAQDIVPIYLEVRNAFSWARLDQGNAYVAASAVPEPSSMLLAGLGLTIMAAVARRRRQA